MKDATDELSTTFAALAGPTRRAILERPRTRAFPYLIDEFHLLLTPVGAGSGQHMFEEIHGAPQRPLADVRRFASGVLGPGLYPESRGGLTGACSGPPPAANPAVAALPLDS